MSIPYNILQAWHDHLTEEHGEVVRGRYPYGDYGDVKRHHRTFYPECQWNWSTALPPVKKTVREEVLDESRGLICGDRQDSYGSPDVNFKRLADTINGAFGPTHLKRDFTSSDIALILVLLKVIRQVNKSQHDNWVDIVGYGALGAEVDDGQ